MSKGYFNIRFKIGMVSPQQFGVGVGVGVGVGGVGSNTMGIPSAQQVLAQQQQQQSVAMQQQVQQMQQQQLQLQQQQQAAMVQQTNAAGNQATTPQTPVPPTQPPPQQQQQNKEFNTASLCRFGQETVQDIVSRTLEVFQTLRVLQPPNGNLNLFSYMFCYITWYNNFRYGTRSKFS